MTAKQFGLWEKDWDMPKGNKYACYEHHQGLKFKAKDGKEYTIYGGSCSSPVVLDADVYIGFNYTVNNPNETLPWEKGYKPVTVINYPISDMKSPSDVESFHKLVDWACTQVQADKKVHAGCMGGHGRTGLFLVAVVAQMTGMKNAIQYVRKNYCGKSVESQIQINFLMKEFGVSAVKETKKPFEVLTMDDNVDFKIKGIQESSRGKKTKASVSFAEALRTIRPVQSDKSIW